MYNIIDVRLKIVVPTDRRTESLSECTFKDLSNNIWHSYQSWKLVGGEENNIYTLGGGINVKDRNETEGNRALQWRATKDCKKATMGYKQRQQPSILQGNKGPKWEEVGKEQIFNGVSNCNSLWLNIRCSEGRVKCPEPLECSARKKISSSITRTKKETLEDVPNQQI